MVSFDIFETLITRTVWEPTGIFLLVQEKLSHKKYEKKFSDYVRNNYAALRKKAEVHARRMNEYQGVEEVTLDEIYTVFSQMAYMSEDAADCLKEIEVQTEIENTVPVSENIELVKACLRDEEPVVLISDMYLPQSAVREILYRADSILDKLPLYLSCESRKTKRNGSLYILVKKEQKAEYSEWVHYGDNVRSDIRIPEMLGIKAVPIETARKMEAEKLAEDITVHQDPIKQVFLGMARNTAQKYALKDSGIIGCFVGGSLLYPYVCWVIRSSLERKYNRLYFIARDGFLLKKIADEIISAYQYPIKTYYIYGSRKAWRVRDEISQALVYQYLVQEVDFSDESFALVDLQGTGTSMEFVRQLIKRNMKGPLNVFYFQMFSCTSVSGCNFMMFCPLEDNKILESFARAPHGTVLGYEKKDGKIIPQLADTEDKLWEKCGLSDYIKGVQLFSREIACVLKRADLHGDSQSIPVWISHYLQSVPGRSVLEFIGDMPHNHTEDDTCASFAPKLTKRNIYELYLWRTTETVDRFYSGTHLPLSLKRMSKKDEKIKRFCERNAYRFLGDKIHRLKYLTKKKKRIFQYKKIIIYAAGQAGRELFFKITYDTRSRVVGWTDINYQELQAEGLPVISPQEAFKCDFDGLVIAVKNNNSCNLIKELLVSRGINEQIILSYSEFYSLSNNKSGR